MFSQTKVSIGKNPTDHKQSDARPSVKAWPCVHRPICLCITKHEYITL